MSNHKFVCFECLQAIKRDPRDNPKVLCPACGAECVYLGVKIPIPPKSKPKNWEELRVQLNSEERDRIQQGKIAFVARKHELEKEILKLEGLPPNKGRLSLLKQLRGQLERINT